MYLYTNMYKIFYLSYECQLAVIRIFTPICCGDRYKFSILMILDSSKYAHMLLFLFLYICTSFNVFFLFCFVEI